MIQSLLIANRSEIACRIIRTARRMGIRTVAVYSDADATALHVRQADEAVHIGPSPARESYLVGEKIIAAAKQTGAEAIHPGYGFLSENAEFAQAVTDAGLVWVGPRPASITAMGLKDAAKKLMAADRRRQCRRPRRPARNPRSRRGSRNPGGCIQRASLSRPR
jgi:3-methylcrotonyl-CoA carboxylase alpha subunit